MDNIKIINKAFELVFGRLGYIENGVVFLYDFDTHTYKKTNESLIDIEAKIKELEAQAKVDNALKNLQDLCDTKSQEAKNYINGAKVTNEQLVRYEEKYEIAKEYKNSGAYQEILQLEADLVGLSADDLADLIIQMGDAYKQSIIVFNSRIEAFRVKAKRLIEAGEIDKANTIIEKARDLGADATDEDVKGLFV